jgi:hypothetical protein
MSNQMLRRRLDRLDGGDHGRVEDMSDAQLLRIISREMPAPASFLAKGEHEQDREIERLISPCVPLRRTKPSCSSSETVEQSDDATVTLKGGAFRRIMV